MGSKLPQTWPNKDLVYMFCCTLFDHVWGSFIIIISCYPLQGHRASTKRRHLILFLASFLTSPQLFPSSNASLWTDLLHVCLGLPLLRFPCGFQSKASFSMASFPTCRHKLLETTHQPPLYIKIALPHVLTFNFQKRDLVPPPPHQ